VIHENREQRDCTVCTRADLDHDGGMPGPLLVEDETATIYVPPGWRAANDAAGNLIVKRGKDQP
jgi:N-methylhydantoinase A/oxoprolinase/acetone carboxylase beta subunit